MRVLSIIALLFCLSIPAFAQDQSVPSGEIAQTQTTTTVTHVGKLQRDEVPVKPKSVATTVTSTSIGVLYLADATGSSATALSVPLYTFPGTNGKLKICTIGAVTLGTPSTQIYVGAAISYLLYSNAQGWSITLIGGAKGFDLTDSFRMASGSHAPVFGFGITVPIKSL